MNRTKTGRARIADAGEKPFITQDVPFTDLPLDEINIWMGFDGSLWTLYLPSNHSTRP